MEFQDHSKPDIAKIVITDSLEIKMRKIRLPTSIKPFSTNPFCLMSRHITNHNATQKLTQFPLFYFLEYNAVIPISSLNSFSAYKNEEARTITNYTIFANSSFRFPSSILDEGKYPIKIQEETLIAILGDKIDDKHKTDFLDDLAFVRLSQGRIFEAKLYIEKAIQLENYAPRNFHRNANLAIIDYLQSSYSLDGLSKFRPCLDYSEKCPHLPHESLPHCYNYVLLGGQSVAIQEWDKDFKFAINALHSFHSFKRTGSSLMRKTLDTLLHNSRYTEAYNAKFYQETAIQCKTP